METQNIEDDLYIKKQMKYLKEKEKEIYINNINKFYNPNIEIKKEEEYPEESIYRKRLKSEKLKKLKHLIIAAAYKFKKLKITVDELYAMKPIDSKPYSLPKSKEFLYSCRDGNYEIAFEYLKSNKNYAFVFDEVSLI